MYRLMQSSQTTIPNVASFTHLFSHSRTHNRVEFLTDFPVGDDAEIISSLQVHPQGWCALSRNVSNGEKSEVSQLRMIYLIFILLFFYYHVYIIFFFVSVDLYSRYTRA